MNNCVIKIVIAAVIFLTPVAAIAQQQQASSWFPLTDAEISDAHSCFTKQIVIDAQGIVDAVKNGTEWPSPTEQRVFAICASDKIIGTGIIVQNSLLAETLKSADPTLNLIPNETIFSATGVTTIKQLPTKEHPEAKPWKRTYWILSDGELQHALDRARREPTWKP